jgi:DNA-binding transcriptional ArsR family regulator
MSRIVDSLRAIAALTALGQATRLGGFRFAVERYPEPVSAGEIADHCQVPHNTMSTHLAILTRAGLLTVQRVGRTALYRADLDGFNSLIDFLTGDCCGGRPEICSASARTPNRPTLRQTGDPR